MRRLYRPIVVLLTCAAFVSSSVPAFAETEIGLFTPLPPLFAQDASRPALRISTDAVRPALAGEEIDLSAARAPEPGHARVADASFWTVAAIHTGLVLADTASTFALTRRCPQCREQDPYTAPIINAGPHVAYPAAVAFAGGVMTLSWWLKKEHSQLPWWTFPIAIAAANAICVWSNSRY